MLEATFPEMPLPLTPVMERTNATPKDPITPLLVTLGSWVEIVLFSEPTAPVA
jgi:hypothetical protein